MKNTITYDFNQFIGKTASKIFGAALIACLILSIPQLTPSGDAIDNTIFYSRIMQLVFCLYAYLVGFEINKNEQVFAKRQGVADYNNPCHSNLKQDISFFKERDVTYIQSALHDSHQLATKFRQILMKIWLMWTFYFSIGIIKKMFAVYFGNYQYFFEIFETLVNNFTGVYLLIGFLQLDKPEKDALKDYRRIAWGSTITVSVVHFLLVFYWSINIDRSPELTRGLIASSNAIFKLISGIFNSIAIIALACRLQSKNINPPSLYIWALFFYAALQPLTLIASLGEVHFDTNVDKSFIVPVDNVKLLTLIRIWALAWGKAMFFLFCLWMFNSKRILNYFLIIPEVDKEDDLFEKYKDCL